MQADIIPLVAGILILVSSLISLRVGLSVAIIEIILQPIFRIEKSALYLSCHLIYLCHLCPLVCEGILSLPFKK
jgi:hypothetical protein